MRDRKCPYSWFPVAECTLSRYLTIPVSCTCQSSANAVFCVSAQRPAASNGYIVTILCSAYRTVYASAASGRTSPPSSTISWMSKGFAPSDSQVRDCKRRLDRSKTRQRPMPWSVRAHEIAPMRWGFEMGDHGGTGRGLTGFGASPPIERR